MSIYDKSGDALLAAYNVSGNKLDSAYDVGGDCVYTKSPVDYSTFTKSTYCTATSFSKYMQAFDIHDGYIFQFLANANEKPDLMAVVDVAQNSILGNVSCKADHGNNASFSDEYYAASDDFPLLYVSSENHVYINRVTTSTSELIKTLYVSTTDAGYYPVMVLDGAGCAYTLGYTENSYSSDNGGSNKVKISKWDMTQMTDNGDNTYTPVLISSIERPFIYVIQGCQWHDSMIWVASGGTNVRGYVYALNPSTGEVLYTYDTELTTEVEGIAWIGANQMVVGYQRLKYELVTFAEII